MLRGNEAFLALTETLIADLTEFLRLAAEASGTDMPKKLLPAPEETLLQNLLEAVASFRISQMEAIMSELDLHEYETGEELVIWLKEQIDCLEYDAIRERLEELLSNT